MKLFVSVDSYNQYCSHNKNSVLRTCTKDTKLVASLGKFDGLHLGHQQILKQMVERARELGAEPAVICFYPHPAKILSNKSPERIFSIRQQIMAFAEQGVKQILFVKFSKKLAALEAEDFIQQYFIDKWNIQELFVGPFVSIGKNRKGNLAWLKDYFGKNNILKLNVTEPVDCFAERVSSNRLRKAVQSGDFELIKALTGRSFSVLSRVRHGRKLGRQLGFRTANLDLKDRVKPPYGVYVGKAKLAGNEYKAIINFGFRPTTENSGAESFEAHLIDYHGEDFYRQYLEVKILSKIREENKFASLDELKKQISQDLEKANEYFRKDS